MYGRIVQSWTEYSTNRLNSGEQRHAGSACREMLPVHLLLLTLALVLVSTATFTAAARYDLAVYGTSAAAVSASYAAARHNLTVLLVTPSTHLGGMTTSGLSHTDVGNTSTIGGLAHDLYSAIGRHYGQSQPVYDFEPHVAELVLTQWVDSVSDRLTVWRQCHVTEVKSDKQSITSASFDCRNNRTLTVTATVFIDASYEGDLLALAGVSYTVGRENRSQYNESLAGVTEDALPSYTQAKNNFAVAVDPWTVYNDSSSGLLTGIDRVFSASTTPMGSADSLVQSINYRLCMTTNASNSVPVNTVKPATYNSSEWALHRRYLSAANTTHCESLFNINALPHDKFDFNNNGGMSTDYFANNLALRYLLVATPSERVAIERVYREFTQGLLYFLSTDASLSLTLRKSMLRYGYCADEFVDQPNHFPFQIYVREGRRMLGEYFMTQHDVDQTGAVGVIDGVALGSYNMDSHNVQRVAVYDDTHSRWIVRNEGDVQVLPWRGPYPVSYRSLVPMAASMGNLLVPVCVSASHMAISSIRMEPVYIMLGHATGVAAAMAVKRGTRVQEVDTVLLRKYLREEGAKLDADVKYVRATARTD